MELKDTQAGVAFLMANIILSSAENAKPKKPNEIPQPGKNPETIPTEEPEPDVWPKRDPDILPGREPLTVPPTAPPDIPPPSQNS